MYDAEGILGALRDPVVLDYDPNPKGLLRAREAVAGYYAGHGASVDPEHIFLTTSTSEAYSFLFRVLCDPGDEVLIAQPSYPLFDFLADLDDVRLVSYPLFYDYGWHLDPAALRERITPRTRAIALVHPNNPTGHFTKVAERGVLEEICAEYGLALIVDESFFWTIHWPRVIGAEFLCQRASGADFCFEWIEQDRRASADEGFLGGVFRPGADPSSGFGAAGGDFRYLSLYECSCAVRDPAMAGWPDREIQEQIRARMRRRFEAFG